MFRGYFDPEAADRRLWECRPATRRSALASLMVALVCLAPAMERAASAQGQSSEWSQLIARKEKSRTASNGFVARSREGFYLHGHHRHFGGETEIESPWGERILLRKSVNSSGITLDVGDGLLLRAWRGEVYGSPSVSVEYQGVAYPVNEEALRAAVQDRKPRVSLRPGARQPYTLICFLSLAVCISVWMRSGRAIQSVIRGIMTRQVIAFVRRSLSSG